MARWSDELARKLSKEHQTRGKSEKPNKFKAVRTYCGKHWHQSGAEASCCCFFQLLEKQGELKIKKNQPNVFVTEARIRLIHDWLLEYRDGNERYADYKGHDSDSWKRNRKLWKHYGDRPLEVWRQKGDRFFISEVIIPVGLETIEAKK